MSPVANVLKEEGTLAAIWEHINYTRYCWIAGRAHIFNQQEMKNMMRFTAKEIFFVREQRNLMDSSYSGDWQHLLPSNKK
jgi:hypothetical protein